jgi:hypothetical protein
MNPAEQAILAVALTTPLGLGLYLAGRWRRGDMRWGRDGLIVAGTIGWAIVLAAAFAGPQVATLLIPPLGLAAGGTYLWIAGPQSTFARIGAVLAVVLGSMGLIVGAVRLALQ